MTSSNPSPQLPRLAESIALAITGGALYFLGFPGFDLYPLAFVALVPFVLLLEREAASPMKRRLLLAFLLGLVQFVGGYYWMQAFLSEFSGLPLFVSAALTIFFCSYLALFSVAFAYVYGRARAQGHAIAPIVVAATVALEWTFPMIFPSYLGNSLYDVPLAIQIADLGGPLLVSAFIALINGAFAEVLVARSRKEAMPRKTLLSAALVTLAVLSYGAYRIREVDARIATARKVDVAMVQVNMGTFSKREDPYTGHRRHLEQTYRLEARSSPDLIVWPESAFTFLAPPEEDIAPVVTPGVVAPVLFGGLELRPTDEDPMRAFNTAFLVDRHDRVVGRYDKTRLVPFGEYIPLGSVFPSLYRLSPNTGRYTEGTSLDSVRVDGMRLSVFICYEDLLPEFTRRLVREGKPNLLVNLTNDAWYGDTNEPWIHLALARFRAVEHHRALVRSTNSGVSAFVDPVGQMIQHSGVFTREELEQELPLLDRGTAFEIIGEPPYGIAALLATLYFMLRPRRRA